MDVSVKEGDVLGGTYRVERVIGAGGMAVVVAAIHQFEPERVAIKILYRKAARSREVLKRFEREQRMIRQMRTEHVSRLLGSGTFGECPYMVMELLKGQDLAEILKSRGALTIEETVGYLLQALEAVAEAHSLGIVHRDLKPGNLFLTHRPDGSPCIKVLDFGIAKYGDRARQAEQSELTSTTAVFGSPFYMSPEQMISAKEVTQATDLWSLGVILHELLTKTLPFAEKTPEKICHRVLTGSPTPLRELKPDYPAALEAIVLRCLQRKPEQRYKNVTDLALSLSAFAPPWALGSVSRIAAAVPPAEMDLNQLPAALLEPARPEFISMLPEEPESPTLYVRPKKPRLRWRKVLTFTAVAAVFSAGIFIGMNVRQPAAAPVPIRDLPSASVAPAASAAPAEDPEEEKDPLADIPVEMDLDDMSPARKQGERKRKAKADAGLDLAGLQAQYESSLHADATSAPAVSTAAPGVPAPKSSATSTASASPKSPSPAASGPP
jgi:serine/threonine-protein kinase